MLLLAWGRIPKWSVIHTVRFRCAPWFDTIILARILDSLVRVSRRVIGVEYTVCTWQLASAWRTITTVASLHFLHLYQHPTTDNSLDKTERRTDVRQSISPSSTPTFPFTQFHALFHSLFKVLFIFPSRYLFAIGLLPIFSLGWILPPILSCIPKQLDSLVKKLCLYCPRGCHPLRRSFPEDLTIIHFFPPPDYNSRGITNVGCSRFTRRYWGNPC